jgi:hypothetical protein
MVRGGEHVMVILGNNNGGDRVRPGILFISSNYDITFWFYCCHFPAINYLDHLAKNIA